MTNYSRFVGTKQLKEYVPYFDLNVTFL